MKTKEDLLKRNIFNSLIVYRNECNHNFDLQNVDLMKRKVNLLR